jgi:hypothetical protein
LASCLQANASKANRPVDGIIHNQELLESWLIHSPRTFKGKETFHGNAIRARLETEST